MRDAMLITALWPDGATDRAPSWQALEDAVRARQWREYTPLSFRREMRRRARVWAGPDSRVSTDSPESLFRSLEALDILRIEVEDEGGDDDADDPG